MNFGSLVYTSLPISKQPGSMHGLINSLAMATIIVASWRPGTVNFLRTLKLHGRSSTIGPEIILKTRSSTTPTKFSKQESEEAVKRLGISVFFACSSRCHPRFTDTCWIIGITQPTGPLEGYPPTKWIIMYHVRTIVVRRICRFVALTLLKGLPVSARFKLITDTSKNRLFWPIFSNTCLL